MFYMSHFDLEIGFGTVVLARLIQGGGMEPGMADLRRANALLMEAIPERK